MIELESDAYRRGLTLGLTMAEIFILILFLLLLVLLALYTLNSETEKQLQQTKKIAAQQQTELIAAKDKLDKRRVPPKDIEHLIRDNKELEIALSNAETEKTIAKNLLQNTYQENDATRKESNRLHTENEKLRAELSAEKGIDPPCWYQVTNRQGKRHEKPYFLMDIAVHDNYLEMRAQAAPPGRATDERGQSAKTSYQEEYIKLSLPPLGTTKKVSLQQFTEITEPIKRMGKNKQIRNYACVFYVKVWDFTPKTAKTRWKKAEDAIRKNFYTLRIRNDLW